MATGRAELMAETYVSRIRIEGRRAKGVDYIGPDGVERSMDAKVVIVAGGAIETPRLLLLSGLEHPALGRHLMVHFQTIVVGHFQDLRLHPYKGRSVTHVHDDAMVQDERSRAAAADGRPPVDPRRPGRARRRRVSHRLGAPHALGEGPRPGHARQHL